MVIDPADLIITVAYFSIPLQIVASLINYPRLSNMPIRLLVLLILFALFIFLCGFGHLLRCMHMNNSMYFYYTNVMTATVSLVTALYLLPLIPNVLKTIDDSITKTEESLEETVQSKMQLMTFMAFLCHEIRNPLFAVTSAITFLSDTKMSSEQELIAETINESSRLMLRLVNDVLDLNRIESGKMELEERDFDLHRLMTCIQSNMSLQIKKKHGQDVAMLFDIDDEIPQNVYGDSTRILQIVYNLLSNSCKFTNHGFIKFQMTFINSIESIEIQGEESCTYTFASGHEDCFGTPVVNSKDSLFESSQFSMGFLGGRDTINSSANGRKQGFLRIIVEDSGIGISSERLENIFEPYAQSKLSDYRKHGGAGLGLPISSSLLKRMGGEISVDSQLGKGTKFTVHIPIQLSLSHDQDVHMMDNGEAFELCDLLGEKKRFSTFDMDNMDAANSGEDEHAVHMDFLDIRPSVDCLLELESSDERPESKNKDEKLLSPATGKEGNDVFITITSSDKSMTEKKKRKKKKDTSSKFNMPEGKGVVLVADDNVLNCQIISKMLTHFNIECRLVNTGKEAVDMIMKSENVTGNAEDIQFSFVLMDLQMPVMSGRQAIETLRKKGVTLPIIALTANALSEEREQSLLAGATEFHTKPILREQIYSFCSRYIDCTLYKNTSVSITTTRVYNIHSSSMPSLSSLPLTFTNNVVIPTSKKKKEKKSKKGPKKKDILDADVLII